MLARLQVANEAWFHITRRGGFFAAYNHSLHSWSGVYQPGQLVMFPSWMLQEVLPYDGDDIRITAAFNARFRLAGATRPDEPLG